MSEEKNFWTHEIVITWNKDALVRGKLSRHACLDHLCLSIPISLGVSIHSLGTKKGKSHYLFGSKFNSESHTGADVRGKWKFIWLFYFLRANL